MSDVALVIVLIFCTPLGWIGLLCLATVVAAARS